MLNDPAYNCRVCGLLQSEPQHGADGKTPTYEICDCCGVEFGYEDTTEDAVVRFRARWMDRGCDWFRQSSRPDNWDVAEQLRNIGISEKT